MSDQEIREKLREFSDRIIMEMKSEEAYEVKKNLMNLSRNIMLLQNSWKNLPTQVQVRC